MVVLVLQIVPTLNQSEYFYLNSCSYITSKVLQTVRILINYDRYGKVHKKSALDFPINIR